MSSKGNITLSTGLTYAWQNANLWQEPSRRAAMFARFWAKVQRTDAKACWPYVGHGNGRGYGLFTIIGRTNVRAHRFSWLASRGEIPAGLEVCHSCDNTRCVNPDHLFLGSHRDNHLDSVRKGRKRAWGMQKLNAEQVYAIRARVGQRHVDIAAEFGIARNTVSQILSGKTWAHLSDPVHPHSPADTDALAGSRRLSTASSLTCVGLSHGSAVCDYS